MERKGIYFTSDWHIGHHNSILYDERPFKDLHHMHGVIINNYNASVGTNDLCYFLGDVGLSNQEILKDVISELNGTKVLILGNHDKNVQSMYNVGFDVVLYSASLVIANEKVTLSHCPLKGVWREDTSGMTKSVNENWHGESRYKHSNLTVANEGQFHLHGHIHSRPGKESKSTRILDKQMDVGVAANNYRPVSISQIESWIAKYKNIIV